MKYTVNKKAVVVYQNYTVKKWEQHLKFYRIKLNLQ